MPMLMMPCLPAARRSRPAFAAARHHLDAGTGEDARLALQPGDREDHHMP